MSKKVIHLSLTEDSINKAIKEVKEYKKWLEKCTKEFLKELGDMGVQVATAKFKSAQYDGTNDVSVSVKQEEKNKVAVVAIGSSVLFIEFGSGIKYPNSHPEGAQNGMIHGEYGYKLGRNPKGWRYNGEPGTNGEIITEGKHAGMVHTYGNPANMSMYLTVRELQQRFEEVAKRCFV